MTSMTGARWLAGRVGLYAAAGFTATILGFLLPRLAPGDPAASILARLGGRASPEVVDALRAALGVTDAPLPEQYVRWLGGALTGDLGVSVSRFPAPVGRLIAESLPWTVLIAGSSVLISFTLGAALGLLAAWRGGKLDAFLVSVLSVPGAFPYFWLAMGALQLFGFSLGWFPLRHAYDPAAPPGWTLAFVGGALRHAALPCATLVAASAGGWTLGIRNTARTAAASDAVLLARARGLSTPRILLAYVLRDAVVPHLASFGMALGFVVSGALLTEVVFSYPGEGWLLVQAVRAQDWPLLQGLVLVLIGAVLGANLLVDVATLVVDPRTRRA